MVREYNKHLGEPVVETSDQVKAVGSVPPREKIKAWIIQAADKLK